MAECHLDGSNGGVRHGTMPSGGSDALIDHTWSLVIRAVHPPPILLGSPRVRLLLAQVVDRVSLDLGLR